MRTWLFPVLTVVLLTSGCESATASHGCTLVGCVSGLQVDFQTQAWPTGAYRVEVTDTTGLHACSTALPLSQDPTTCAGFQLQTSGSALPTTQQSLAGVHLQTTPSPVTIEVLRDGKSLTKQTFQPVYTTASPNGAGCEPTCTQAHLTMTW
jgi:hypothetical protein